MGKVYVITGSTSGIGKELVNLFAKTGDNLVFAGYRSKDKLPAIRCENVKYFYIDMNDDNSIVSAGEFIKSQVCKIDTLINVAGSVIAGPIEKIEINRLRNQFDVNVFSHILFTQTLMPVLKSSKIINISSMSSFGNFPFISPYCASKRSLDIFFNALELENHENLKVVSVKPGVIATPIWEKSVNSNMKYFSECEGYEKELNFLKSNALKNSAKGLEVAKVAQLIQKIDNSKNPKASYTIGRDAKFAQIMSILPQDIINKVVKFGLKCRMK